jgi:hypothetical protein
MRTIGFIIAFSFAFAGPSLSSTTESGMPGIGTFSFNGSGTASIAPATQFAHLTLTRRA